MTTRIALALPRGEIATWILTSPAVAGMVAWLVSWIGHFASRFSFFESLGNATAALFVFVLAIGIGSFSSLAALILIRTRRHPLRFSMMLCLVNGIWMIVSLAAFGVWFLRR